MAIRTGLALRRVLTIGVVAIASALIEFCFSISSMAFRALPPAHHAEWMALVEGACASRLQLDAVNAAVQWYGGPVAIGVTGFIVGTGARLLRAGRSLILTGMIIFAVAKGALGAVLDAPSIFSVFFALICTAGGWALSDAVTPRSRYVSAIAAPEQRNEVRDAHD
jgi:hypothetical protein